MHPWTYESMYFGNAVFPSGRDWRYSGVEYQMRGEEWFDTFEAATARVLELQDSMDVFDVEISTEFGEDQPLVLYWIQLGDGDAMEQYMMDKKHAMGWTEVKK